MFENLDIFAMSSAMARHAGQRQAIVAQNVANADTPGYSARDIPDFRSVYAPAHGEGTQRASRVAHLHGSMGDTSVPAPVAIKDQSSPNGNRVSLETEMLRSVDAKRSHDRALAIYKTALNVLRSTMRTN